MESGLACPPTHNNKDVDGAIRMALMGGGIICVSGCPSCGKTTTVLSAVRALERVVAEAASKHPVGGRGRPKRPREGDSPSAWCEVVKLEVEKGLRPSALRSIYLPTRAFAAKWDAAATYLQRHLGPETNSVATAQRDDRISAAAIGEDIARRAATTEVHVIVDDADLLPDEKLAEVETWFHASHCAPHFYLWIVSQRYLSLRSCFRQLVIPRPTPQQVLQWFDSSSGNKKMRGLLEYALTHNPTASSLAGRDYRLLLHSILDVADPLAAAGNPTSVDYVRLLKASQDRELQETADAGVLFASRMSPSARLLFVAAFYCGAVSSATDSHIFGDVQGRPQRRVRDRGELFASTLSSSTFTVAVPRLRTVYSAMTRMCSKEGALEFLPDRVALHHLSSVLEAHGYMVPLPTNRSCYRCHIALPDATDVAATLSMDLFELLPPCTRN